MHRPNPFSSVTLPAPNLISRTPLRRGFPVLVLALALACFALSPTARAVDPPPDGGYPNGNTAEGNNALFNSQPASATRPPVLKHSQATPPATATRPTVLLRSYATPAAPRTPPPVAMRSLTTRPAASTLPAATVRLLTTAPPSTIPPAAPSRSFPTPPAARTPPPVAMHSGTTL